MRRLGRLIRWILAVALTTSVTACIPIGQGISIPAARMNVSLTEPLEPEALFATVDRMARNFGFAHHHGYGAEYPRSGGDTISNSWTVAPTHSSSYSLRVSWSRWSREIEEFGVAMNNWSALAFTLAEWEMFRHLRDQSLPRWFPDAEIEVTRHPAEVTQPWDLERIAAATGEPLPPDAQRRVERWEARSRWEQWRERTYWTLRRWWYRIRTGKLCNNDPDELREAAAT